MFLEFNELQTHQNPKIYLINDFRVYYYGAFSSSIYVCDATLSFWSKRILTGWSANGNITVSGSLRGQVWMFL